MLLAHVVWVALVCSSEQVGKWTLVLSFAQVYLKNDVGLWGVLYEKTLADSVCFVVTWELLEMQERLTH